MCNTRKPSALAIASRGVLAGHTMVCSWPRARSPRAVIMSSSWPPRMTVPVSMCKMRMPYFIGATNGNVRANHQHRNNTIGTFTTNCNIV